MEILIEKSTKGEFYSRNKKNIVKTQLSVIGIFHQQNVYVLGFWGFNVALLGMATSYVSENKVLQKKIQITIIF